MIFRMIEKLILEVLKPDRIIRRHLIQQERAVMPGHPATAAVFRFYSDDIQLLFRVLRDPHADPGLAVGKLSQGNQRVLLEINLELLIIFATKRRSFLIENLLKGLLIVNDQLLEPDCLTV